MMDIEEIRSSIIRKINACEDEQFLAKLEDVLNSYLSEVKEEKENHLVQDENISVPDSHYKVLEEEFEKYKRGEITTSSWVEVKRKLQEKHGL